MSLPKANGGVLVLSRERKRWESKKGERKKPQAPVADLSPLELTAEKMLYGGFALARTEELGIVFVDGLMVGETGRCVPVGKQGGIPYFETKEVLTKSVFRRLNPCAHYGICGGCSWLHIEYEEQIRAKESIFADAMNRIGKISTYPKPEIFRADEFGYRCRAQFKVDQKTENVGFFKSKSNDVEPITNCPLLSPNLNKILDDPESIRDAAINSKRGMMLIDTGASVVSDPVMPGVTKYDGVINIGEFRFKVEGDSFFQSNRFLTEPMANWCSDIMQGNRLLDLFGGVGLFSLFHGKRFKETVLVELSSQMATKAQEGFLENGFTTGSALGMSSESFFDSTKAHEFDTVIVDPPRTGLSNEVRNGVMNLAPEKILYISCNPTTMARDLGVWVNHNGYKIERTALFDLYPNTWHMEAGVLLVRNE